MSKPIRVLIVEDSEDDSMLLVRELRRGGYEPEFSRVETAEAMTGALTRQTWDLVISDYTMPHFSGTAALELLKRSGLDLPFIVVSGSIGEDLAVAAMKAGAHDYLMKGSLRRLLSAIERELREAEVRSQRRLAEAVAKRNLERIKDLHEIDLALASTLDLRTMLNLLLEKIDLILPGSVTTIRLFNKKSRKLEPVACRNIDEASWRGSNPEVLHGFTKIVLENRIPLAISNVQSDPRNEGRKFACRFGLISYLGIPLIARNELLGIIAFYTKEEHAFSDEEIEFLTGLANQTAVAVFNAKLYAETSRGADELSALHSLTTAITQSLELDLVLKEAIKKITAIFHFDATRIYVYNDELNELQVKAAFEAGPALLPAAKTVKRGQGIVGRVVETGESFVFEDIAHDPRYAELSHSKIYHQAGARFLGIFPIATKLKIWGVLVCVGGAPRELDAGDASLLASMRNQIGIAMENATLYEQTATKAKELSALYSIAAVASASLDMNVVLHKTMEKVLQIYGFDAARIYLRQTDSDKIRLAAHEGMPQDISLVSEYRIGEGRVGKVMETAESLYVEDMRTDAAYNLTAHNKIMVKAGFRGSFIIPIKLRGDVLGVMNFLCREPHHFKDDEIRLTNTIAHHVGMFVGNANLFSQINKQKSELENANKAKDEFLSVMSHELRTPLNVIDGYAQLLKEKTLGEINSDQVGAVKHIMRQSSELLNMINGVLQVTQIEANVARSEAQEVNLSNLLDDLRMIYVVYGGSHLAFRWDYPSDLREVITDGEKLKHILQNLINNAIKFTEKGQITVTARHASEPDFIELSVADTGIGIPKESLRVIFERFRQLDSSETRNFGGVGIGLYIVKSFTEMLGGTVNVASEVGVGSIFTITIPQGVIVEKPGVAPTAISGASIRS